ncbi:leucine-rich repeat extensin-like protein 1 [Prosopis cineraria]|uniref:leucine-rich repeat extensin-like protein 1 n=1 Tax=Prosopis cineraria TaxID=364024 RepID=UPI002410AFB4|nr:leucine-rich repeat extensin-like protein 1 [Prosopis cineraria]
MGTRRGYLRLRAGFLLLYLILAAVSLSHCDAERSITSKRKSSSNKHSKKLKAIKHFGLDPSLDSSNVQPYSVSSPFSLPPYESLAPIPLPDNGSPPFCVYPPNPPSTGVPSPTFPAQGPPPGPSGYFPTPPSPYSFSSPVFPIQSPPPAPEIVPSPPTIIPGSPEPVINPPIVYPGPPSSSTSPPYFEPSPPYVIPSPSGGGIAPNPPSSPTFPTPGGGGGFPNPPISFPSPSGGNVPGPPSSFPSPGGGSVPSPIVFQPPIIYPPPIVPPPPYVAPVAALWCVAKPSVPDPIMQEGMNYACWSGADCGPIQPNGPCFFPDSVYAHASYAFNSYWQVSKANGGSCDFGGIAMLVAVDPSYDGCHFVYN